MSNSSSIISLNITRFPQNLLIPNSNNDVGLQIINNSNKSEILKFDFSGEGLDVKMITEGLSDQNEFAPNETKNIDLSLIPTADGIGKFILNIYSLKIVEYSVRVQKVKETVPSRKFDQILNNYIFKGQELIATINPKEYILFMTKKELEKAENQLQVMKKSYESLESTDSPDLKTVKEAGIEDIDNQIMKIAKGYLSNDNLPKSLELALTLSTKYEQNDFYSKLIRAYAFDNPEEIIKHVKNLTDINSQRNLLKSLIVDKISSNPSLAVKLTENIDDAFLRIKFLFNIVNRKFKENRTLELANILKKIIELLLNSIDDNKNDKKSLNIFYEALLDALNGLAEIESPSTVDTIIKKIDNQQLKEKLTKDIYDFIYELVDEIRTETESEVVFSQYFLLNTYVSNVNNAIKNFCTLGGNLSNNILTGDHDFKLAFLSLFSFDFSVFPIIDRLYSDLKTSSNKSFAYFMFPSVNNYQNNELDTLRNTLNQFFQNFAKIPHGLLIFNLDFIPYLGKPTIILSTEPQTNNNLKSKIEKLGNNVSLIIDNSMFKAGKIYEHLKQIFPPNKCEIVNLILSYEFINNYKLFKGFIQSLF
ncbi:MAG: hypothetical protein ACW99E_21170 [Promethearchaeota archaeon]|jgi:hypothetical protein